MEPVYTENEVFDKIDFTTKPLARGEYELCRFINCDFSNTDISGISFSECELTGCNISLTGLIKTVFRDVKFKDCKMLGLHFENCDQFIFTISFDNCVLDHSSFYQTKLKKTLFKNCRLHEADFSQTDLSGSMFDNCDLMGATFENTILEKADLRTSYGYSINPEINRIKKAKFSLSGLPGLLDKYDIEIE